MITLATILADTQFRQPKGEEHRRQRKQKRIM